ncbi:MAG: ketoacyl-ACP synthase III [bacterium]|nr:ketoacyl-ACP synthase III [bacterium]
MAMIRTIIKSVGGYLPERIMTNEELVSFVDTSDEWITERTGIKQRHIAAEGEFTSDLALAAAKIAMQRAELDASDIDLVIVGTTTPDRSFPSTACIVQAELGMTHGAAFDLQAACSGFLFGLAIADSFIISGTYKRVLVIGAETLTRLMDYKDRNTCILFGDGAGAAIVEAGEGQGEMSDRGILSSHLRSDGRYRDLLTATGGPSSTKSIGTIYMDGREVFKHGVRNISEAIFEALKVTGFSADDVDWFVSHQANGRILEGVVRKVKMAREKVVVTVDKHANTSAASVPLALNYLYESGKLERDQLVLFEAMGGGFTWGSVLARW